MCVRACVCACDAKRTSTCQFNPCAKLLCHVCVHVGEVDTDTDTDTDTDDDDTDPNACAVDSECPDGRYCTSFKTCSKVIGNNIDYCQEHECGLGDGGSCGD